MSRFRVTVKNYRAFSDERPATIEIGDEVVALVGPNNSGKSSLLKMFYELRRVFEAIRGNAYINNFANNGSMTFELPGVEDALEIYHNGNDRPLSIEISVDSTSSHFISTWRLFSDRTQPGTFRADIFAKYAGEPYMLLGSDAASKQSTRVRTKAAGTPLDHRDMADVADLISRALYIGPYRSAIAEGRGTYYDLAIGTSFIDQWNQWKAGGSKHASSMMQRVTDDIGKIFGYQRLEINSASSGDTLQIFADGYSYRLRELGAGIAQFITVLGNAAVKQPSVILIDEPELNLHPSLQVDFLLSLAAYAKAGIVFATHSIGLARSTADRLYSCKRQGLYSAVGAFEQTTDLPEFLGEMSFSSFKELGHDTVLLVEGVTEVKAVQQLLRLFRRDHEIIVLPMGGDRFIKGGRAVELGELGRLTKNIAVLIDSEKKSDTEQLAKNREEFIQDCKTLGYLTHVTERRAFENYFTARAIQSIYGGQSRALEPYEKLGDAEVRWPKNDNWRIARAMTEAEILGTDLGDFLRALP